MSQLNHINKKLWWLLQRSLQNPGIKTALLVTGGIFLANNLSFSLFSNILLILILLIFTLYNNKLPQRPLFNAFCYILLLFLTITLNFKIRLTQPTPDLVWTVPEGAIIQVSSVVRYTTNHSNKFVTVTAMGKEINFNGENRRLTQPVLLRFAHLPQPLAYGTQILSSGIARPAVPAQGKPPLLLISAARLISTRLSWYTRFKNMIYAWKKRFRATLNSYIPSPLNEMGAALLLGERRDLPSNIVENFRFAGVSHVLAISGLHLGLLLGYCYFLLKFFRIPHKIILPILLAVMLCYVYLVNFQPSVIRAALMASLVIIGALLQRQVNLLNILGATVTIIAFTQPQALMYAGMQLSVAATFFIIATLPPLEILIFQRYYYSPLEKWFARLFLVTLSAWLGILPLSAWYFQQIYPLGLVASLIVVPLVGMLLFLGFLLLLMSFFSGWVCILLGKMFFYLGQFILWCVEYFSSIPGTALNVAAPSLSILIVYYLTALVFASWLTEKAAKVPRLSLPALNR